MANGGFKFNQSIDQSIKKPQMLFEPDHIQIKSGTDVMLKSAMLVTVQ